MRPWQMKREPNRRERERTKRNGEPDQFVIELAWLKPPPRHPHRNYLRLRRAPGAKRTEHHGDEQAAATTDDERKQNCQDRATSFSFVRPSESDAVEHQPINSGNQTAAEWNHLQRPGRSVGKGDDAEREIGRASCRE